MNIKILDNFLDEEYFNSLKNTFTGQNFPWYFQKGMVTEIDGNFQCTHGFFKNNIVNSN